MNKLVLFDKNSDSTITKTFTVFDDKYYLVRAYGFEKRRYVPAVRDELTNEVLEPGYWTGKNQRVTLQSVLGTDAEPPSGTMCEIEDIIVQKGEKIAEEDVTQCGVWFLDACQNTVILSLPGTYQFELNDQEALGSFYLVMSEIPRAKAELNRELNLSHIDCMCK